MDDNKRSRKSRLISLEWALAIAYALIAIVAGIFYKPLVYFVADNTGIVLTAEIWGVAFGVVAFIFIFIACKKERFWPRVFMGLFGLLPGVIVGAVYRAIEERWLGGDGEATRMLWLFLIFCVLPFVLFILYGKLEDRKKRGKQ